MDSEIGENETVSTAVVRAVSAVEGRDPRSLRPLSDVLDPGALDTLFGSRPNGEPRSGGCLSFVYSGCRVTIDNGEYLTIQLLDFHRLAPQRTDGSRRSPGERGQRGTGLY